MIEENNNTNENNLESNKNIEKERISAALSYVWILCLVPLISNKDSKFIQFHAKQGLILFLAESLGILVYWFPLFGQMLFLVFLVVSVLGAVKAYNGEWWKIPYIYEWSKKILK